MNNQTIFIADLHLAADNPKTLKLFIKLLNQLSNNTDALYILGDLFRFWSGDDDDSKLIQEVIEALKKATDKTNIYLMPGNRDFLLGSLFAEKSRVNLIKDPYITTIYGNKIVLTHGDLLCANDIAYRLFRKVIRQEIIIKLFLILPLSFRKWLAQRVQKFLQTLNRKKNFKRPLIEANQDMVKKLLIQHQSKLLIYGHIHQPSIKQLTTNVTNELTAISLADWNEHSGSILVYSAQMKYHFVTLTTK